MLCGKESGNESMGTGAGTASSELLRCWGICIYLLSGSDGCLSSTSPSLPPATCQLLVTTLSFMNQDNLAVQSVGGHWELTIYKDKVCGGDSHGDVEPCELSILASLHMLICSVLPRCRLVVVKN